MTARAFLVRGLLAGLLAGLAAFACAYVVGEPHVQAAIALEEAHEASAADDGHTHTDSDSAADDADAGHHHDESGTVVSRHDQRTWGLLTGTLATGLALGGLLALAAAFAVGRLGRLTPRQAVATTALVGWVAFALVPFLKYPANPPGVGDADTIGARTTEYFAYLAISVLAAVGAVVLGRRLLARHGAFAAVVAGIVAYLVVVVAAGQLLPTVNEVGDFPGDTLWYFRRASLFTTATLWAVLGTALAWAVGRLHEQQAAVVARRELAASL